MLTAVGVAIRLDGCGYWHQAFVIAGNIAYGGAALWLAFDVARRAWRDSASAMWAVVLVACAGNLAYYMTAEASLAHAGRGVRRESLLRGLAADPRAPRVALTPRGSARWSA